MKKYIISIAMILVLAMGTFLNVSVAYYEEDDENTTNTEATSTPTVEPTEEVKETTNTTSNNTTTNTSATSSSVAYSNETTNTSASTNSSTTSKTNVAEEEEAKETETPLVVETPEDIPETDQPIFFCCCCCEGIFANEDGTMPETAEQAKANYERNVAAAEEAAKQAEEQTMQNQQ